MDNLAALREEHARDGIGPLLHELLSKIIWSTVRQYPPSEYSAHNNWEKPACEDVLNDWVTERLWGRADLQAMLTSAPNTSQLRAALTTSLRQFLANKRRRTIASNLYKRIAAMMQSDPQFQSTPVASSLSERPWTIAGKDGQASTLSIEQLVQIAFELGDDQLRVVKYGPFSQKLSPILRDNKLREFLYFLLTNANGSLTIRMIVEVMRFRFSLPVEEHIELEDSIPSTRPNPEEEVGTRLAARGVVSRLSLEQFQILAAYFKSGGDVNAAARVRQRDPERIREVVHDAFAVICESADSEENARSIMNAVESLVSLHGD